MSVVPPTQDDHTFSGNFRGQRDQWIGNTLNTEGNSYISPSFVIQSLNVVFPILHPPNEDQNATGRHMVNNGVVVDDQILQDSVHTFPEVLARLEDVVRRARGFDGFAGQPQVTGESNARCNTHRRGKARVLRIMSRFMRGLPVVVSHIRPILSRSFPNLQPYHTHHLATSPNIYLLQTQILRTRWHCLEGLLILAAGFFSALTYRNVCLAELYTLIQSMQSMVARMQDDKLARYASFFVTILASIIIQKLYTLKSPSEHFVILEDVYQRAIPVPVTHFNSLNILKGFLKDQYAGSNAEPFIEANLFSITIDRRDGVSLDPSILSVDQQIKPRTRLVMAIMWQFPVKQCLDCDSTLNLEVGNWLSW